MASCISRCKDTTFTIFHNLKGFDRIKHVRNGGEQIVFPGEAARDVQSEGEAAKDYKVEVMVGMSVSKVSMPSE